MISAIISRIKAIILSVIMLVLISGTFLIANYGFFYMSSTSFHPDYKLPGILATIEGRTVHYIEKGQGAPLIIVPDLGFSAESFTPVIDRLSLRYHVIVVDMIGQGYTDRSAELSYTQADYDVFFNKFLAHLGLPSASFLVHGNSGFILRSYQQKYSSRVSRLVLLDHLKQGPVLVFDNKYISRPFIGEAIVTLINRSMLAGFIRSPGYYNPLLLKTRTIEVLSKCWGFPGVKPAYLKTIRNIMANQNSLSNKDNRTVYIYSQKMVDTYPVQLGKIPSTRIISRSGYFSYWENPDLFSQMVFRYI